MPAQPRTREAIAQAIRDFGPMTCQELAQELGMHIKTIASCLSYARSGKEKHFHVVAWRPQRGISGLPAGVYALGDRRDAKPPVTDRRASQSRYYQNNKARIKVKRGNRDINPFTSLITQVTS
ncbi:hypothetical protein [Burkholderia gladioli]|uniref:hypothetical protein n=1 Tax=Burkholderia gladioli TaxID=28095 RepID=UPI0016400BB1|nr:hypothetical protein [Burkholderia gladioli]